MPDDAKDVLIRYGQCFRQHHDDWPAPINWPKDMKLAQTLLKDYTPQQLGQLVEHMFVIEDEWIRNSGLTFGVFYACLGKILVSYQRKARAELIKLQQQEAQQRAIQQMQEWKNMTQEERDQVKRAIR